EADRPFGVRRPVHGDQDLHLSLLFLPALHSWHRTAGASMGRRDGRAWSFRTMRRGSLGGFVGSTLPIASSKGDSERAMAGRSARFPKQPRRRTAKAAAGGVRIVVADHHAIDRGGMVGLLENEPDLVVVGEAATADEALAQCRSLAPDVLVLTLNLPGQPDTGLVPHLLSKLPD